MNPLSLNRLIVSAPVRRHQLKKQIKKRRTALKNMDASLKRLKAEMQEISAEQRCIREGQRQVREKFEAIESECLQLKKETQLVLQQSTRNKIRLALMFRILKAREDCDFAKATELTRLLREMVARDNRLTGAPTNE
ncbi:hypothetical protein SLEP1_g28427 [Rubroshorea leprosula]|uniref:Uncharacterized protein n=1 Tax=Rubroshorea leprosula TaxID=152421 RepID=A0AAV5K2B1_9ROSI|nr:hypothetical protein SLEP1_g28427 [Rubroshorea leprosula]